jgi:hypothetical protein
LIGPLYFVVIPWFIDILQIVMISLSIGPLCLVGALYHVWIAPYVGDSVLVRIIGDGQGITASEAFGEWIQPLVIETAVRTDHRVGRMVAMYIIGDVGVVQ